jgi:hypothetical protein
MTGPIYRYDPDLKSDIKLPPHFHRIWFITDFNQSWVNALYLTDEGDSVIGEETAFPGKRFYKPLAMDIGPDGALYINNYSGYNSVDQNTSISRIEYTGDCLPDRDNFTGTFEKVGCTDPDFAEYDATVTHPLPGACVTSVAEESGKHPGEGLIITGLAITVDYPGEHTLHIHTVKGEVVFTETHDGPREYSLTELRKGGIYIIRVNTRRGRFIQKCINTSI